MSIGTTEALQSLRPTAKWSVSSGVVRWLDDSQAEPTTAEINTEIARLEAEYNAQEYARNRATAYASTGDQLDMQYWDSVNDTTTWKDHVASVKNQYPKS